jgi:hypothetical protein
MIFYQMTTSCLWNGTLKMFTQITISMKWGTSSGDVLNFLDFIHHQILHPPPMSQKISENEAFHFSDRGWSTGVEKAS